MLAVEQCRNQNIFYTTRVLKYEWIYCKRFLLVFQYAILMTVVLTTFIKYTLHTIDLQSENPWDNKAVYMLYTELFTGTYKRAVAWMVLFQYCLFTDWLMLHLSFRFHQGAFVYGIYDHNDKSAYLPSVCHSTHVSCNEVSDESSDVLSTIRTVCLILLPCAMFVFF